MHAEEILPDFFSFSNHFKMIGQGGVILTCAVINNTAFDAQWRQPNDVIKHQNGSEWGIFLFRFLETFVVLRYSSQHGERSKN